MDRRSEQNRINELREEVEEILAERGVEIDFGPSGKTERALKANHPELVQWKLIHALARAIDQNPITAKQLEEIEGVGPSTAQKIIDRLS